MSTTFTISGWSKQAASPATTCIKSINHEYKSRNFKIIVYTLGLSKINKKFKALFTAYVFILSSYLYFIILLVFYHHTCITD